MSYSSANICVGQIVALLSGVQFTPSPVVNALIMPCECEANLWVFGALFSVNRPAFSNYPYNLHSNLLFSI